MPDEMEMGFQKVEGCVWECVASASLLSVSEFLRRDGFSRRHVTVGDWESV